MTICSFIRFKKIVLTKKELTLRIGSAASIGEQEVNIFHVVSLTSAWGRTVDFVFFLTYMWREAVVSPSHFDFKVNSERCYQHQAFQHPPLLRSDKMGFTKHIFYFVFNVLFVQHVSTLYWVIFRPLHKNKDPLFKFYVRMSVHIR
jgi:hypothetical protein